MDKAELIKNYKITRQLTERLCQNLLVEDYVIQSIDDVSPPKWHLAHTTWFFETFILGRFTHYKNPNPIYHYIFNSYYQGIGKPYPRCDRGLLARPSVEDVYRYRKDIDEQIINLITNASNEQLLEFYPLTILGINHEQQHQELLLMDIKHNFYVDPSYPVYSQNDYSVNTINSNSQFIEVEGGLIEIGYQGNEFCFDNELPRHQKYIQPYSISNVLISNKEYLEFILDDAYSRPELWLSDAWDWIQINHITAPLYWIFQENNWLNFTLQGLQSINPLQPVSHISFYEADAFARWKKCRLPIEEEWEHASLPYGELWEWTSSSYLPYPGYKPLKGAVGEYNGKFMNNQRVLRGGSFATPPNHTRISYRNFYGPDKRWQFSGIRLAMDN